MQAALVGVTAAVVGVVLNLAVFFGLRVLFPPGRGLDIFALVPAAAGYFVRWRWHVPIDRLVPAGALIGLATALLPR